MTDHSGLDPSTTTDLTPDRTRPADKRPLRERIALIGAPAASGSDADAQAVTDAGPTDTVPAAAAPGPDAAVADPTTTLTGAEDIAPDSTLPDLPEAMDASDAAAYAALKARRAERRRRKLIRRGIVAGVAVGVLAIGAVAVHLMSQEPEAVHAPITDIALAGTYTDKIDASGSLEPLSSTVITPGADGTIAEIRVAAGQQVNAGDVLMVIDNPELDLAVSEAARSLQAARADLSTAKRARTDAYNAAAAATYDEEGNAVAPEVDTHAADDAVDAAERAVAGAQAAYDQAVARAGERTVTAPIGGSIVSMNAQVGADTSGSASGSTGSSGPLMQIADLSQMKVTVQVGEEDIARVAVGQTAQVSFPAFDGLVLEGTVQNIASIASGTTGDAMYMGGSSVTFAVDILIPQPDPRLKPGMTAQVTLVTEQLDNVVMVPTIALMTDDGSSYYVLVETDPETHATKRRDVEVVTQNDSYAVVGRAPGAGIQAPEGEADPPVSPLSDGEALVISGGMSDTGAVDQSSSSGAVAL